MPVDDELVMRRAVRVAVDEARDLVPAHGVGDRVEAGVQLLQLWTRANDRAEEVLVLYPQDGYWRARPLPPANLKWSAYGSSFLVGPIEVDGRPFVNIREVVFDPNTRSFRLQFVRGGSATLRLETLDTERQVLDVTLEPVSADMPFAALRSMFVTEINNDVAQLGWRLKGAPGWERAIDREREIQEELGRWNDARLFRRRLIKARAQSEERGAVSLALELDRAILALDGVVLTARKRALEKARGDSRVRPLRQRRA